MRPILWGTDADDDPPTVTVLFPSPPYRVVTLVIEKPGRTRHETEVAAIRQVDALAADEIWGRR